MDKKSGNPFLKPDLYREQKQERLQECLERVGGYVTPVTVDQLHSFIERDHIYPANAAGLLVFRAGVLSNEGFPDAPFQITREELPIKTKDSSFAYSPFEYLGAVIPRASLFPLRSMVGIQKSRARAAYQHIDPVESWKRYRQGTNNLAIPLNERAPDVKKLRGVMLPDQLMELMEVAVRCHGDSLKETLFCRFAQEQFRMRIERYDHLVSQAMGERRESTTGKELRELMKEENIRYLLQRLSDVGKKWVEARPAEGAVIPLRPSLKDFVQWFQKEPFWFASLRPAEIQRFQKQFEEQVRAAVQVEVLFRVHPGIGKLLSEHRPSKFDPYLSTPLKRIAKEEIDEQLDVLLSTSERMLADALNGGTMAEDFLKLFEWFKRELNAGFERIAKEKRRGEKGEELSSDADLAEVIAFPGARDELDPDPNQPFVEKLNSLILLMSADTRWINRQYLDRFYGIARRLAEVYMAEFVKTAVADTERFGTTDFYSPSKPASRLYPFFCFFRRCFTGKNAEQLLRRMLEAELMKLPDESFGTLYAKLFLQTSSQGRQTFSQFILPAQVPVPGGARGVRVDNSLPVVAARLRGLLRERPELFPPALINMAQKHL